MNKLLLILLCLPLTASAQHSVSLAWTPTPNTTTNVKRSTTSGGGYALLSNTVGSSYVDSNVQPGTTYVYVASAVDPLGNESPNSPEVGGTIPGVVPPPPPPPACVSVPANTWSNQAFTAQTGTFTASFDVTPASAAMDSVVGLSNGAASAFASLAAIVWFNPTGTIQDRNGANYGATAVYKYAANTAYHVTLTANRTAHTYSVWVHTGTAADTQIANNYAFRTEQNAVAQLSNFSAFTNAGQPTLSVCNFALGTAPPPPPPPPPPTLKLSCTGLVCTVTQTNNPTGTQFPVSVTGPGGQSSGAVAVAP